MKMSRPVARFRSVPEQGVALVIVLGMLVIILGLAMTFLSRVSIERSSAASYAASATTRQLADTAVSLVQGQIRDATTLGGNVAWASQPGMIRTFASGSGPSFTASNSLHRVYKLYSASELISTAYAAGADAPPATWAADRAVWSDLNAPASGPSGALVYPILDNNALNAVEGFNYTSTGFWRSGYDSGKAPSPTNNPAPMPVRWLYQLRDGTLVAPSGSGATATVAGADPVSNPIVGRIAFWTDDETCKVNINTASEGSFWSTPLANTAQEQNLAKFQPAQREFQAYPGHPASVSLAPIFFATSPTTTPALSTAQRESLFSVVPRIVGGGSQGGTFLATGALTPDADRLYASVDEMIFNASRSAQNPVSNVTPATVERSRFFLTASSRAPEVTLHNTPRVSVWPTSSLATRTSRALRTPYDNLIRFCAEVPAGNLYGFQRSDSKSPTADWSGIARNQELLRYLQAISGKSIPGFGASMEGKLGAKDRDQLLVEMFDYIRSTNLYDDNLSPLTYANQALADDAVQFTGGRRSGTAIYDAWQGHGSVAPIRVPQGLTGTVPTPGTETPANRPHMGFGRFHTICEAGLLFICNADGKNGTFAAPLNDSGTPLVGAPTVQQLANLMSNVPPGTPAAARTYGYRMNQQTTLVTAINPWTPPSVATASGTLFPENRMLGAGVSLASDERRIQMMLFFDLFSPMLGWTQYTTEGSFDVEVSGSFNVGGKSVSFASAVETVNLSLLGMNTYHPWGGHMGFRKVFAENGGGVAPFTPFKRSPVSDTGVTDSNRYGLISLPFTVKVPASGLMSFEAPVITVKFYGRQRNMGRTINRTAADLVQTIELDFPDASFCIPSLQYSGMQNVGATPPQAPVTTMQYWWSLDSTGAFGAGTQTLFPTPVDSPANGGRLRGVYFTPGRGSGNFIRRGDTLKTLVPYHADTRLVAASSFVPAGVFQPSTFYFDTSPNNAWRSYLTGSGACYEAHDLSLSGAGYDNTGAYYRPGAGNDPVGITHNARLVPGISYNFGEFPKFAGISQPGGTGGIMTSARPYQQFGDFDQGMSVTIDGAYINKPDEGNSYLLGGTKIPYFNESWQQSASGPTFFSPNRQIPGPGMFGSLPTKLWSANEAYDSANPLKHASNTWRTLLFRPQPNHPGAVNPPDHLWMDLFWMPVVEPYAISEPFSTAGKINMNYAIEPFSHIQRRTGMVSLLRSERVFAIPNSKASGYKAGIDVATPLTDNFRIPIDAHETLKQLDTVFSGGSIFRSPTELCDLHLVPQGSTVAGMASYWSANAVTGDNARERPYTNLVARLTTKSNTYTVHYRVQALKQPPNPKAGEWDETRGVVTGEFRGSTTIERYITPKDTTIPDYAALYAASPSATPSDLGTFYKWRTLNTRQFAP